MRKILSTFVAVAMVVPASLALAGEPASTANRGEATDAGTPEKSQPAKQATDPKRLGHDGSSQKHARQAVGELERADPGLTRLFEGAAGYAVFPTVGKGAVGVGGAHGEGVVYEKGRAVGETTLTQLTVGLQLGGQAYTEVIFFETDKSLADFKKGEFAMAAQVSAVIAAAGASANAKYVEGVSVFTLAKGGLMAEASVGGQKFSYQAFAKPKTSSL